MLVGVQSPAGPKLWKVFSAPPPPLRYIEKFHSPPPPFNARKYFSAPPPLNIFGIINVLSLSPY